MADKTKDAKKDDARMSSIAKTLNKVEDRLEKSENCDSVAEGLANAAKASELLSSLMDVAADPAIAIPSRHEGIGHRWRFHSWF